MEANPQPESQSSFQAVSRKWGVKLPWLQCPPHLNCNFLYFSNIQKDGSSTLRDPLITEKDSHKLSSTSLSAHQAFCLFCFSFVLCLLIMDIKSFICTRRFLATLGPWLCSVILNFKDIGNDLYSVLWKLACRVRLISNGWDRRTMMTGLYYCTSILNTTSVMLLLFKDFVDLI